MQYLIKYLNRLNKVWEVKVWKDSLIVQHLDAELGIYSLDSSLCKYKSKFDSTNVNIHKGKLYSSLNYSLILENFEISHCEVLKNSFYYQSHSDYTIYKNLESRSYLVTKESDPCRIIYSIDFKEKCRIYWLSEKGTISYGRSYLEFFDFSDKSKWRIDFLSLIHI